MIDSTRSWLLIAIKSPFNHIFPFDDVIWCRYKCVPWLNILIEFTSLTYWFEIMVYLKIMMAWLVINRVKKKCSISLRRRFPLQLGGMLVLCFLLCLFIITRYCSSVITSVFVDQCQHTFIHLYTTRRAFLLFRGSFV